MARKFKALFSGRQTNMADAPSGGSSSTSAALAPCRAHVAAASASLDELELQLASLGGGDEALRHLTDAAATLDAVFSFVDELEHHIEAASAMVEATGRRLEALERNEQLPPELEQLAPAIFSASQFARQIRRRDPMQPPELPELSLLPPCAPSTPTPARSTGGATHASADLLPVTMADVVSSAAEVSSEARERAAAALAAATDAATRRVQARRGDGRRGGHDELPALGPRLPRHARVPRRRAADQRRASRPADGAEVGRRERGGFWRRPAARDHLRTVGRWRLGLVPPL